MLENGSNDSKIAITLPFHVWNGVLRNMINLYTIQWHSYDTLAVTRFDFT